MADEVEREGRRDEGEGPSDLQRIEREAGGTCGVDAEDEQRGEGGRTLTMWRSQSSLLCLSVG